jgi:hypothetical protein
MGLYLRNLRARLNTYGLAGLLRATSTAAATSASRAVIFILAIGPVAAAAVGNARAVILQRAAFRT